MVSGVRVVRTNEEIREFNNIPMSTVKKHMKEYTDFIDKIMTSPGKVINVAATLTTTIFSKGAGAC